MIVAFQQLGSVLNGQASYNIERDILGIDFKIEYAQDLVPEFDSIKDLLGDILVTCYVNTKTASQTPICTRVPLSVLLEFTQNAEGAIYVRKYANGSCREIAGFFQICPVGALTMQDDETIVLNLQGLLVESGAKYTIYGREFQTADHMVHSFDTQSVAVGQTDKQFDLSVHHTLILPVTNGVLDELQINYSNGKTVRYTEPELKAISRDANDIAVFGDLLNYGFSDYYVLNISNATQCVVTTNGAGLTAWTVRDRAATKSVAAVKLNGNLADTTDANIMRETNIVNSK